MTVKRELTAMDIVRLSTEDTPRMAAPVLQRLRAVHHLAAQHLAAGRTIKEVAALVDRTPQSISDLSRNDPSFKNLVAYYQDQKMEISVDAANRMQADLIDISELAVHEIQSRLEDPAKIREIPIGELRQVAAFGTDRTIAPPKTTQPVVVAPTHITFNMGTKDLRPKTIDQDGNTIATRDDES